MQIKKWAKWTTEQVQAAFRLRDEGLTNAQIARRIGRTQNAVCARLSVRSVYASELPRTIPRATIAKAEVPHWYELGWRLASFENGVIIFEWPTNDPPLYPRQKFLEAA